MRENLSTTSGMTGSLRRLVAAWGWLHGLHLLTRRDGLR